MYNVTKMFNDGYERKKTLFELANEIESDNPKAIVEIISQKKGRVWLGQAKHITSDLRRDYLNSCVQGIEEDEFGITLIMR